MIHFNIKFKLDDKDKEHIEFYDPRFPHTELGQFVASYYVDTLMESEERLSQSGLALYWDVPIWRVSPSQMKEVFNTIKERNSNANN